MAVFGTVSFRSIPATFFLTADIPAEAQLRLQHDCTFPYIGDAAVGVVVEHRGKAVDAKVIPLFHFDTFIVKQSDRAINIFMIHLPIS